MAVDEVEVGGVEAREGGADGGADPGGCVVECGGAEAADFGD